MLDKESPIEFINRNCGVWRRPVSARGLGPRSRRFKSSHPDQHFRGCLAQMGERLLYTQVVGGSSPLAPTIFFLRKVSDSLSQALCSR